MGLRTLWNAAWRHRVAAFIVAVLAVLAIAFGPRLLRGPEVDAVAVVQRDFVQTVVASGHVEAPHRVSIGTQITGTVKRVPVAEGQSVAAGQVLIELEDAELRAAALQAEVAVQQGEARLRQLREVQAPVAEQSLRQAEITLDNARAQARRAADLFQRNFIGQAALDDANKAAALAEAQWRSAQRQLETARPRGSDYAMALSALAQARASADVARSRLRYATIVAPAAGTLIARDVEPGDVVQPGKALMLLSPSGVTELVVQIDERNLGLLALGQRAQASADAYPDSRFAAELVYINPGIDAQRGSVEVKLAVARPPAYLRQDMTVSVDIQVASRERALLVPTAAIRDLDRAEPWVHKIVAGHARRQRVRIGLRGGGMAEAIDGLGAGYLVVASANIDLEDGARLRPLVAAAGRAGPQP
jgi:HlyD family secretion protein